MCIVIGSWLMMLLLVGFFLCEFVGWIVVVLGVFDVEFCVMFVVL